MKYRIIYLSEYRIHGHRVYIRFSTAPLHFTVTGNGVSYPLCSPSFLLFFRLGRWNLVLRYSLTRFISFPYRIFEILYVEWQNSTPRFVLLTERAKENIKQYFSQVFIEPRTLALTVTPAMAHHCTTTAI